MDINTSLLEKIVYNVVNNDKWLEKNKPMFKPIEQFKSEYKLDVSIRRFFEYSVFNDINIIFRVTFTNYKNPKDVFDINDNININKNIYLQYMREEKLRDISVTQEDKIRQSLSEYLEFDSDELFKSKFNLVRVFGGAVRDILAEQTINDIDILCGSKAMSYIESVLEQNGYQYMEMLNGKDLQEMYSEIHIINEPHTWIKGKKIVQLIRPVVFNTDKSHLMNYEQGFRDLISNVDLSCCGVSYDGENLYEDYTNAIVHCQNKVYSVNKSAKMYSGRRINHRIQKLKDRGWKEIESKTDVNRDMKINVLFN